MDNNIVFSIIMPSYNSSEVIRYALDSIRYQNYDLNKIECLVVDGGSTDNTCEIANEYSFVKILNNPQRLPEYAKLLGFQKAKGKYVIKLDSDEAFHDMSALSKREEAFSVFPQAKLLIANKLEYIKGYGISGKYLNACGDPFTYFMYRPKETIIKTYASNIDEVIGNLYLFKFSDLDIRPIADGGSTTFNLQYAKDNIPNFLDSVTNVSSVSDFIFDNNGYCICIDDDFIDHRSKSQFKDYLNKIKFRIINNVFKSDDAGFSNRKIGSSNKKYLFVLYVLSLILPMFDSLLLCFKYRNFSMLLHTVYCYYTFFCIAFFIGCKILNINIKSKGY